MKSIVKFAVVLSSITLMACEDTSNKSSQAASPTPTPLQQTTPTAGETIPAESQKLTEEQIREASELQCVRDLCGPESNYLATRAAGPFGELIPERVKQFLNGEVKSKLSVASTASVDTLRRNKMFLDQFLPTLQNDDLDQAQLGLLLIRSLIVKIDSALSKSLDNQNGHSFFNFDKIPKELVQSNPALYQQAVYFLNVLRASDGFAQSEQVASSFDAYKSKILGNSGGRDAKWAMHLSTKLNQAKALEQKFGKFIFADVGLDVYNKAAAGQPLSTREKNVFIMITQRVIALNAFNEQNVKAALGQIHVNVADLFRELQWDSVSAGITDFLATNERTNSFHLTLEKSCNEAIVQAIAAAPSDFRLKRAQQLLDGVKVAAKAASQSYFSGKPLEKAQAVIDSVKFETPKNEEQVRKEVIADLTYLSDEASRKLSMSEGITETNDKVSYMLLIIGNNLLPQSRLFEEGAKTVCDLMKPSPYEDQARKEGNDIIIRLGWQTASFHQIGAGIMAHEIGHAVSSTANILESSAQPYWKVLQCSSDLHKALRDGKQIPGKESQYQEEDWADSFAVTTINILNKTWPHAENFGCGLVGIQNKQYKSNSLLDLSGTDSHSTGLLRAVQVHLGLGKTLPASCSKHFGEKDTAAVSKTCHK